MCEVGESLSKKVGNVCLGTAKALKTVAEGFRAFPKVSEHLRRFKSISEGFRVCSEGFRRFREGFRVYSEGPRAFAKVSEDSAKVSEDARNCSAKKNYLLGYHGLISPRKLT